MRAGSRGTADCAVLGAGAGADAGAASAGVAAGMLVTLNVASEVPLDSVFTLAGHAASAATRTAPWRRVVNEADASLLCMAGY